MKTTRLPIGRGVVVLFVVPGLLAEGRRVAHALTEAAPSKVAVGVSPGELDGLVHFIDNPVEDEGWTGEPYAAALSRFGSVGFPPPAYVEAVRFAVENGVPRASLDLTDEVYDEAFTKSVSTWQWWRHGRRVQKLEKRPPRAATAEDFAAAWDARLRASGKGIRSVEATREASMAAAIRELAARDSVVAVVDGILEPGLLASLK